MKLATFTAGGATRIGIVVDEEIVDLTTHAPGLPTEMTTFLQRGNDALAAARRAVETAGSRIPLDDVRLESPILRPPKILAIGLNYADHVRESGREAPEVPMVFNKQSTAATGPYDPIHLPRASQVLYDHLQLPKLRE